MHRFITEYKTGGRTYGSEILAVDQEDAERICQERNIGEVVAGQGSKKSILTISDIHMICFMSFIALKSGKMTIDEVLGDGGVLHEAIHMIDTMDGSFTESSLRELEDKLVRLIDVTHSAPSIPTFFGIFNRVMPRCKAFG